MMLDRLTAKLEKDRKEWIFESSVITVVPPSVILPEPIDGTTILKKLETCIRIAYKSEDRTTEDSYKKLVQLVLDKGHESTLEHVSITFRLITNRGVTHELVRHRIGCSYTQESTRYVNYGKHKPQIIYPVWLADKSVATKYDWFRSIEESVKCYLWLIKGDGCTPQEARDVLPHALKTEIVCTMNLRALRHLFDMRCAPEAHPDMRVVAMELRRQLQARVPLVFDTV